jgi:hypothetical protein
MVSSFHQIGNLFYTNTTIALLYDESGYYKRNVCFQLINAPMMIVFRFEV